MWPGVQISATDAVVYYDTRPRTQNGHIRNDTRDASRQSSNASRPRISRQNRVANDHSCTCVTPQQCKEGVNGSSPLEGF
jgi:hypothetical protein